MIRSILDADARQNRDIRAVKEREENRPASGAIQREENNNPSALFSRIAERAEQEQARDTDEAMARAMQAQLLEGLLRLTEMKNRSIYKADGWNALMSAYGRFRGLTFANSGASASDLRRAVREMIAVLGRLETYKINDEPCEERKRGLPVPKFLFGRTLNNENASPFTGSGNGVGLMLNLLL